MIKGDICDFMCVWQGLSACVTQIGYSATWEIRCDVLEGGGGSWLSGAKNKSDAVKDILHQGE